MIVAVSDVTCWPMLRLNALPYVYVSISCCVCSVSLVLWLARKLVDCLTGESEM